MKARKRQKMDGDTKPSKKPRIVKADSLPWKSVSLPDRMDDYEGFFGLEEIDDVDVMRDEATGQVRLKCDPIHVCDVLHCSGKVTNVTQCCNSSYVGGR